jgi:hypothetical protein
VHFSLVSFHPTVGASHIEGMRVNPGVLISFEGLTGDCGMGQPIRAAAAFQAASLR